MFIIKSILYRLIQMIVVLFVISTLAFILMKLSPGNPVDKILHLDVAQVSTEQINATKDKLGLNDSLLVQWWHWMNHLLHFNLGKSFEPISWLHLLGTDDYGRDLFTRIIIGARSTLFVTVLTLIAIVVIGVTLGLFAGYKKGWIERLVLRFIDVGLSIPEFIIMIALASFFQPSLWNLVISITVIKWMNYTRLTRSIVNSEMNKPYIKMAQLFHVPIRTILIRHLTPKIIPAIIVLMVVDFGKIILYISSLSFIGLGAQPPTPEWGAMLQQGRDFISSHPIMLIAPASVIAITILIFNLTGDALRDRLLKQRGEYNESH